MRFCKQCGAQLTEGAAFCPSCGTAISAPSEPPVQQPVQQPAQDNAQRYQQQYEQYQQPRQQYQPPQQPVRQYQQPAQAAPASAQCDSVMSMGRFLGALLLMCIPVVGFILQIVWACGGCENLNLRNFARAYLLFTLIAAALAVIVCLLVGNIFVGVADSIMCW